MFKKKKTYIDKIDFDIFEDDEPEDFDLFSKEKVLEDNSDIETDNAEEAGTEDTENEIIDEESDEEVEEEVVEVRVEEEAVEVKVEEDADEEEVEEEAVEVKVEEDADEEEVEEEVDEEADEETVIEDDEEADDEESDEKIGFTYDDFYNIDKEIKENKKEKDGNKGAGKVVLLVLLWVAIFGAGVFAFLYFQTDLFKKKKTATTTEVLTTEVATATDSVETTEEPDENFYSVYTYETNADININALMADYYDAMIKGDSEKLKDIVTEPEAFGDMMIYETKAQVISEYSNITCYTIPGLNEGEILVFTTSNVTITGVESKPLDIKQFYVVKEGNNYKINNGVLSKEVIDYINVQLGSPDVQALYKSVQDNINRCLEEDPTFADFYNKISTNTDAEEEQ